MFTAMLLSERNNPSSSQYIIVCLVDNILHVKYVYNDGINRRLYSSMPINHILTLKMGKKPNLVRPLGLPHCIDLIPDMYLSVLRTRKSTDII
jgi:hypothetical protein